MRAVFLILAAVVKVSLTTVDAATIIARRGSPPAATFPTANLVHYWRGEEGDATYGLFDAVGSTDLTPVNDPARATGKLGACRDFVSASDMSFTGSTVWSSGSFTFSTWVYLDDVSGTHAILSQGNGAQWAFRLLYGSGIADFRFSVTTNGLVGTETVVDTVGLSPTTSTWYHVACGYDATAQEIWIEVDGGTRYTASFTGTIHGSATSFDVGIMQATASTDMEGRIDDIGYWSASLSESDVEAVYGSDISGAGRRYDYYVPTGNLLAHYPLDEASGNATDAHGSYTLTGTANITTDTQLGITGRDFSSTTDYLTNASVPASANMSVSGWIYHPFDLNDRYWFSNGAQAMGAASVEVGIRDTGSTIYPRIVVEDSIDGTQFTNVSGSAWTPPAWRHIVVTRNAAGTEYRFFVNGVLGGVDSDSAGGLVTTSADGIALGDSADGTGSDWIGLISHVSIFSDEIDPGMVAELYGNGTPPEL